MDNRIRSAMASAAQGLIDRDGLVDAIVLAALAGEHVLVIGPPGTAKSEAVRRVARVLGGRYFEYLLGRFTEPAEVFGPVNLTKLRAGTVEIDTTGMLPEAEVAFLDEVFQGSTAILNSLLGLLNERTFLRGHTRMACPLRVCVGASNALPEDESLAAFADRFLVRVFLESVSDARLEHLLQAGWALTPPAALPLGLDLVDEFARRGRAVDLEGIRPVLAEAIRRLRGVGVNLSDRRLVRTQRLIAAATVIDDRSEATAADLWPLVLAVPTAEQQQTARETLHDLLEQVHSATLPAAAMMASHGAQARARLIVEIGEALLGTPPAADDETALRRWRLRLEGVLREIDAGFVTASLPSGLKELRERLAVMTGSGAAATASAPTSASRPPTG
ncbi:MAG: AAA family ATPase [Deltaproteobacteria bacterium]|nr:AAA family ATPase [Deltaproteobacteria bacterium]